MPRGGPRCGSGRPGYRLKSEDSRSIDIRRWNKAGLLRQGRAFVWEWDVDGEPSGSVGVVRTEAGISLNYKVGDDQRVLITSTPCHFGGVRTWFRCPACFSRAAVLYLRGGRFACRRCQSISYRSQSGSATDRISNTLLKLEARLEAGKPKWQRWATYRRLCSRFEAASEAFDARFMGGKRGAVSNDLCPADTGKQTGGQFRSSLSWCPLSCRSSSGR